MYNTHTFNTLFSGLLGVLVYYGIVNNAGLSIVLATVAFMLNLASSVLLDIGYFASD